MGTFRTINDLDVNGKTVLLRADLNLPMQDGKVTDDTRILSIVPTVAALRKGGAKVVILSHFGRPKGKVLPEASLKPVVAPLAQALCESVVFAEDCIGSAAHAAIAQGNVILLENLRFHAGEEANDSDFAAELAALGDIYVNDAFSAAHRAHASTEAIAHLLPSAAGRAMASELEALERALGKPEKPVCALIGGAKISTKLDVLGALVGKMDYIIIGGGMANTFLKAQGIEVGASLCENDLLETAAEILSKAESSDCKIILPVDAVVAQELAAGVPVREVTIDAVDPDDMILDFGGNSIAAIKDVLSKCRTLVWNGPLGAFEIPPFDRGTTEVAREAALLTQEGKLLSVAGGGDTVAALNAASVADQFSHVSTAGGAFLEWMEGKELPGVNALKTEL